MKKNRKNKTAPPPGLPPESKQPVEEQPKKQPFLKRLLFGEETPDLSELEAGSTTILDIWSWLQRATCISCPYSPAPQTQRAANRMRWSSAMRRIRRCCPF